MLSRSSARAVSAAVTAQCEGLILREERPLVSQDGYLLVAARDGERLPAGGLIAVEARSAEALAAARSALFDGAQDVPEAVMALSEAVDGARGDVRAALDALETALSGGRTEAAGTPEGGITADEPGLFSSYSDGLWQLAAEDCDTPPELAALLAGEVPPAPAAQDAGERPGPDLLPYQQAMEAYEREYLSAVVSSCGGDLRRAAGKMGLHLSTLYRKLEKLGLKPPRSAGHGRAADGEPTG